MIALPEGLTRRPATTDDAGPVYELIAACELDLDGATEVDRDDIVSDFGRPGVDLDRDSVLVYDADSLAGWAMMHGPKRAEADVHPTYRGRGLGAALLSWTESRARERGGVEVNQTATDSNGRAIDLFVRNGYRRKDTAWILEIAMGDEEPAEPLPPAGVRIRNFDPGPDDHEAYRLIETAFNEWPGREPWTFEDWAAVTIRRETFAPQLSPLAVDGEEIVGAVLCLDYGNAGEGYVHQLAVNRSHRNRGIARALLSHAFREFHRRGRRVCSLSTNSYTGALGLYERVGMHVRRSYTRYSKGLDLLG